MNFWDRIQKVDRRVLYLILILTATVPLFFNKALPNVPDDSSESLYLSLARLQEGDTVIIQTDWTNATRGENGSHFEALIRALIAKKVKFALVSAYSPLAPAVARDVIGRINGDLVAEDKQPYRQWDDWVDLGFFPNMDAAAIGMRSDLRQIIQERKETDPQGQQRSVLQSPVFQNIKALGDIKLYMVVTGTNSINSIVARLSGAVPIGGMVTGVMGPELLVYYDAGQLVGLANGLKGVYDLEQMMSEPYTYVSKAGVREEFEPILPGFSGRGTRYYLTLTLTLILLVGTVVIGNLAMVFSGRKTRRPR